MTKQEKKIDDRVLAGKKILVAEDERSINRLIQVNLERYGCRVKSVFDGEHAWKELSQNYYDMLVTDIMMPKLDGHGLMKKIRASQDARIKGLPTIMLTAKSQDRDVFIGWQQGCDAYLTKPFNPLQLVTFMKRIITGYDKYSDDEGGKTYEV